MADSRRAFPSKRGVQEALDHLEARRLVRAERESITAVGRYAVLKPWAKGTAG